MKKILFFLTMILSLSCTNSSSPSNKTSDTSEKEETIKAKESLKMDAQVADKLLAGKDVDFMTKAVSVKFDGKNLVYTYEIDEEYATIEQLEFAKKEEMEQNIKATLESIPQFAVTKANLKKINGKVVYNYVGSASNNVMVITIDF